MTKKRIEFTVEHTLTRRVVRNLKIVKEAVDKVTIQVVGYQDSDTGFLVTPQEGLLPDHRFSCDIEAIWWEGRDIFPILEAVGGLDRFEEVALRETMNRFLSAAAA